MLPVFFLSHMRDENIPIVLRSSGINYGVQLRQMRKEITSKANGESVDQAAKVSHLLHDILGFFKILSF